MSAYFEIPAHTDVPNLFFILNCLFAMNQNPVLSVIFVRMSLEVHLKVLHQKPICFFFCLFNLESENLRFLGVHVQNASVCLVSFTHSVLCPKDTVQSEFCRLDISAITQSLACCGLGREAGGRRSTQRLLSRQAGKLVQGQKLFLAENS